MAAPLVATENLDGNYITIGLLGGRMVVLVWTPGAEIAGEECRRIISMRKANDREQARYLQRLGQG